MSTHFFELYDDVYVPRRWRLLAPRNSQDAQVDDRDFLRGVPVEIKGPLRVPVEFKGRPLDFSGAGIGYPVVHVRVADLLAERASDDVQLIPVDVEGYPEQYLILVAKRLIRCIDEQRSRIQRWTEEDGIPEMVGKYISVRGMRIDRTKVGVAKVFRAEGWTTPLIVSGDIKAALVRMGATGAKFKGV
jgi:hypothetical protein